MSHTLKTAFPQKPLVQDSLHILTLSPLHAGSVANHFGVAKST
jgi:hypothetical protein